jgi:hypothetical protein
MQPARQKPLRLREAAEQIGYSERGLRQIVERSRQKNLGYAVDGPTIKFMQAGKNSTILFKQEWLDEFIDLHTVDPSKAVPFRAPIRKKQCAHAARPASKYGLWS